MTRFHIFASLCLTCALVASLRADNPLIPTVYSTDPSAHVWPGDGRMWLYCSHDQPATNTHNTMVSYLDHNADGTIALDYFKLEPAN